MAVVGAGLGGIATAVNLARAGIRDFTVFEQSAGPGGTWWDNTFPGAAVDVPSELYSYSFMPHRWRRSHATQAEIQEYLEKVIERFELAGHLRFCTAVRSTQWDEHAQQHRLTTEHGEELAFEHVVAALGQLNHPRYPAWPGLDSFAGPAFHTARWEHDHDLAGKRVAVVGTGSTSAQVVPALAPTVDKIMLFQREPAWVLNKGERDFSEAEQTRLQRWPLLRRIRRARAFWAIERIRATTDLGSDLNERTRQAALDYIASVVTDPETRDAITPAYPFYCKRPVLASGFYPALTRPNVTVVPHAVKAVTPTGVVDTLDVEHEIDALVMATGFQPANFLATLEVTGRGGRRIHDAWGPDAEAFLGLCVPGFPNFFMLYGPNTNGGSIIFSLERQAEWVTRTVRHAARRGRTGIEVHVGVFRRFNRWVERGNAGKAWDVGGCNNYYRSATGKIVTQWPYAQWIYGALTRLMPGRLVCRTEEKT